VRPDVAAAARLDYRSQTRGMGLRMTETLRDRLRPTWLKMRAEDSAGTED
jgi:hypothetical protein